MAKKQAPTAEPEATTEARSMSCWIQFNIPVDVLKAHGIACGDGKQTTRKVFRQHILDDVLPGYFDNLRAAAANKGANSEPTTETPDEVVTDNGSANEGEE